MSQIPQPAPTANVFVMPALADLHKELEPHYGDIGRPSVVPTVPGKSSSARYMTLAWV